METISGDGSKTGLVMKKGKKIDDCYRYQPHPRLQRRGGEQQQIMVQLKM